MNCENSTSETSPTAQTGPAPLTCRYSSTMTKPWALRNFAGIYEELGNKPKVGIYKSVINFSPPESVSSCRPFGSWAELMTLLCSLISTFRLWRDFAAVFDTLAGLPSRIACPPAICKESAAEDTLTEMSSPQQVDRLYNDVFELTRTTSFCRPYSNPSSPAVSVPVTPAPAMTIVLASLTLAWRS